jgi:hypothetical protein
MFSQSPTISLHKANLVMFYSLPDNHANKDNEITKAIASIVSLMRLFGNLTTMQCNELENGLQALKPSGEVFLLTDYRPDTHKPTISDVDLVCKHYKIASKVADLLNWMHRYQLHNPGNLDFLNQLYEFSADILNLKHVRTSHSTISLATPIFNSIVRSYLFAYVPLTIKPSTIPVTPIAYEIERSRLQEVIDLYAAMKPADKSYALSKPPTEDKIFVQQRFIIAYAGRSFDVSKLISLINELHHLCLPKTTNIPITLNYEHLYAIACILAAASNPTPLSRFIPDGYSDYIDPSHINRMTDDEYFRITGMVTHPVDVNRRRVDLLNKDKANALLFNIFGEKGGLELTMSWFNGAEIFHFYDSSWMEQFISTPQDQLSNFMRTAVLLAKSENWRSTVNDLHYITQHLRHRAIADNQRHKYGDYSYPNLNRQAFMLASSLRWLGEHGLDTAENKDRVYEFVNEFDTLNYYKLMPNDGREVSKSFNRRVFNIIAGNIQLELINMQRWLTNQANHPNSFHTHCPQPNAVPIMQPNSASYHVPQYK